MNNDSDVLMKQPETSIQTLMFSKGEESVNHCRINKPSQNSVNENSPRECRAAVAAFLAPVAGFQTEATQRSKGLFEPAV